MFDIGWTEMLVVAIIAIIFVGPKELPGMLRTFGRMMSKIRGLAGDFQRQMDNALKEAELSELKDGIDQVRKIDPTKQFRDQLNPLKQDLEGADKDGNEKRPPNNAVPGFTSAGSATAAATTAATESGDTINEDKSGQVSDDPEPAKQETEPGAELATEQADKKAG